MGARVRSWISLAGLLGALICFARSAHAGPLDLDDDDDKKTDDKRADDDHPNAAAIPMPVATIRMHAYSLTECLLLAERNAPQIWQARARLARVHGELEEARWTPWSYWSASSQFGYLPPIGGTAFYNATPY